MVKSAVALIEVFKLAARKIITFIAKADQPFPQQMAMVIHIGTVLATRTATRAIRLVKTFLFQVILQRQIVCAYTTVHTAGRNKLFVHFNSLSWLASGNG